MKASLKLILSLLTQYRSFSRGLLLQVHPMCLMQTLHPMVQ